MKTLAISLFIIVICVGTTHKKINLWSNSLKFNHQFFKAKPDAKSSFQANCNVGFKYSMEISDSIKVTSYAYQDPYKSWIKQPKNDYLIKHEKLHFDIAELCHRQFRMKYNQILKEKTNLELKKNKIKSLFTNEVLNLSKIQKLYDLQTKHSLDTVRQIKWNDSITYLLKTIN